MRALARLPLRARLTLAAVVALAAVLAASGLFVLAVFARELDDRLRAELAAHAAAGRPGGDGDEWRVELVGGNRRTTSSLSAAELRAARRGDLRIERDAVPGLEGAGLVLARPVSGGGGSVVVAAVSRDDRDEALASLRGALALAGVLALAAASAAAWALAGAALRPVEAMRRRAAAISRLEPGARLPVAPARDELARLGGTLNDMLARLERAAERERGFVAAASHELRTPLALLRGELELALRPGREPAELRAAIVTAAEETDRLARLADDLLVLARADEGRLPVRPEELVAADVLTTVARRFATRAAGAGRSVRVEGADGVTLRGDRLRVEQALGNLVDNALRHGTGAVVLTAVAAPDGVELHVRDEGPGPPPGAFARFARGDAARDGDGSGLGLAIVDAVARAHGGEARSVGADVALVLSSPPHGRGSTSPAGTTRPGGTS